MAKITDARCSPHTFRHFFAVEFLRAGGNIIELQRILGHSNIETLLVYVKLAQSDVQKAHARFTPLTAVLGARYQRFDEGAAARKERNR
jgi:integrase/recombinase XerD